MNMAATKWRFRDSAPLRIGLVIIVLVSVLIVAGAVATAVLGFNGPVGPIGVWMFLWLVLGTGFVIVGIGQTIVRRRKERKS